MKKSIGTLLLRYKGLKRDFEESSPARKLQLKSKIIDLERHIKYVIKRYKRSKVYLSLEYKVAIINALQEELGLDPLEERWKEFCEKYDIVNKD